MGLPAHGFDTIRMWEQLEPWEQDIYLAHFANQKGGKYRAKEDSRNNAERRASADSAWQRFAEAQRAK